MAGFSCTCGTGGIGNLGLPKCNDLLQVVARLIIVPTYDNDGNRNSIKDSDLVDGILPDQYFNDKLTEADASKRWYVTDKFFDEVEISNTDRTTQTTSSGAIYELLKGVMTFSGKLYKRPPAYSGQLNATTCGENSTYFLDTEGRLMGEVSIDGTEFLPLEMQEGSIVSEWFPKSDTSESYVSYMFQIDRVVSPSNFLTIPSANIAENLKKVESLIDVTLTEGTGTQTTSELFVEADYSLYGSFGAKGKLEGKTNGADWIVTDKAGIDTLTVTTATEQEEGSYQIDFTGYSSATTFVVKYVENRATAITKGFESNSLEITP